VDAGDLASGGKQRSRIESAAHTCQGAWLPVHAARPYPERSFHTGDKEMEINSLQELYVEQLKDLYDAEHQIIKALPKMIDKAESEELKDALNEHLEVTKEQANRIEKIFSDMGDKAKAEKCKGMQGVIAEGDDLIGDIDDPSVRDAAIIARPSASNIMRWPGTALPEPMPTYWEKTKPPTCSSKPSTRKKKPMRS